MSTFSSLFCCCSSDHLRRIRTNETDRSLLELTGDVDVFLNLHKYFVFLIKAGGQRVVEVVLEGPPPVMAKAEPSRSASLSGPEESVWPTLDKPVSAIEFNVVSGTSRYNVMTVCEVLKGLLTFFSGESAVFHFSEAVLQGRPASLVVLQIQ